MFLRIKPIRKLGMRQSSIDKGELVRRFERKKTTNQLSLGTQHVRRYWDIPRNVRKCRYIPRNVSRCKNIPRNVRRCLDISGNVRR